MIALVTQKPCELVGLCQRFNVEPFDLFGAAATNSLQSESRDLGFRVDFANREPTCEYADRYRDFAEAAERLFQQPVDFVTERSVRNPYLGRVVEVSSQMAFERADTQASV